MPIHGEPHRRTDWTPVVPPILQSSTFTNPVGSDGDGDVLAVRQQSESDRAGRKYALLEGAESALFLASGMAATALAHLAVLRPGDHLLTSSWIYGGTKRLFDEEFARFGIDVTYVNPDQPRLWRRSVRKSTRAIFVETPTNPLMRVLDLTPMAQIARDSGLALLVDATFASPINFRPLEHGADIVITSATKYLNGHSDVIAGAVAGSASFIEEVNRLMMLWGQSIDPHAAWLVDRGLRTLELRMNRHNANGMAVATWASQHAGIVRVHYPGLAVPPRAPACQSGARRVWGHGRARIEGRGSCHRAHAQEAQAHHPRPEPGRRGKPDLRAPAHLAQPPERRTAGEAGIPDGFVRLSCGIENAADIIADLEQAIG